MRHRAVHALVAFAFTALAVVGLGEHASAQPGSDDVDGTMTVSAETTVANAPAHDTTTTAPDATTTTEQDLTDDGSATTIQEHTTTTVVERNPCRPGWGQVLPNAPITSTVTLAEAGTWALTGHAANEDASAFPGELEFLGYGTFAAPTVDDLEYDLGEVTVDIPTVLGIQVVPHGRISVCVVVTAALIPIDTTTTTRPPETTTTTAPPATTTTTAPPGTTTTTEPPWITASFDPLCEGETLWLGYHIDADGLGGEATVTFSNDGGSAEWQVPVGTGRVLWPGVEVDANGDPTDWPGWRRDANGHWVLDPDDPFMWARDAAQVTVDMGATFGPLVVQYPTGGLGCDPTPQPPLTETSTTDAPPPGPTGTQAPPPVEGGTLPVTGGSTAFFAAIGVIALALGAAMVGLIGRRSH